jgi:hypothetical protein
MEAMRGHADQGIRQGPETDVDSNPTSLDEIIAWMQAQRIEDLEDARWICAGLADSRCV